MSSSRPSTKSRPVLVEAADVAGGHQAVDDVLAAAAGVALEEQRVADEDPPDSPGATSAPSSPKILTVVAHGGLPAVPGAARRSAGVATVA